ncbi:MAG: CSLREA domain-containing protein, partial [Hyphomicrobiales bacterium]|nr:CSLREA domain-containing protein [Hyphomicrobiales bacterium]
MATLDYRSSGTGRAWWTAAVVIGAFQLATGLPAIAAAFVVTTADDGDDGTCDARHCTLREAIKAANSTAGPDTIAFDIGGIVPHIMRPSTELPHVTERIMIDGTTEPDYTVFPVVQIDAPDPVPAGRFSGLWLEAGADGSIVRGLSFTNLETAVRVLASDVTLERNAIGVYWNGHQAVRRVRDQPLSAASGFLGIGASRTLIGGPGQGNLCALAEGQCFTLVSGRDNVIAGNLIGTDPAGTARVIAADPAGPLSIATGILLRDQTKAVVGGPNPGDENVIANTDPYYYPIHKGAIVVETSANVSVHGNRLGTDASGTHHLVDWGTIACRDCTDVSITENVILTQKETAGPTRGQAIYLIDAQDVAVQGNIISWRQSPDPLHLGFHPGHQGIVVHRSSDVLVGGVTPDAGNEIQAGYGVIVAGSVGPVQVVGNRFTGFDGSGFGIRDAVNLGPQTLITDNEVTDHWIGVWSAFGRARITANAIHGNSGLGIALDRSHVGSSACPATCQLTFCPCGNDAGDIDGLQNYPVLESATPLSDGSVAIEGFLESAASTTFEVELFNSRACNQSGHGEGESLLAKVFVTTDDQGIGEIALTLPPPAVIGAISATATGPIGTSEFSNCLAFPPTAEDDFLTAQIDQTTELDVLANDSDPMGELLTAEAGTQPQNGVAAALPDAMTYTPNPGFAAWDTFDYAACDPGHHCDTATVVVAVIDMDWDRDGVLNDMEPMIGTDPNDPDSDGDGLSDGIEAAGGVPIDTDGDGAIDPLDSDSDGDGLADGDPNEGTTDTDGDGIPNFRDGDDDNDGIFTAVEISDSAALGDDDVDGDGIVNWLDSDSDGNGIRDGVEGRADLDENGVPPYLDPQENPGGDRDGDGIPDRDEIAWGTDPDNPDSDGDGLSDLLEILRGPPIDSDGDGRIDPLDPDSDGDGLNDGAESADGALIDSDGDGVPDFRDPDDDGDGLATADEMAQGRIFGADVDGDGVANHLDADSDGDGIPDALEAPGDTDGDGIPEFLDANPLPDTDGDGIPDDVELSQGLDPNSTDSDGDGIADADELLWYADSDGDGLINALDPDSDNDGLADGDESVDDLDGDGVPDRIDADDDGDGIPTSFEIADAAGNIDPDKDGLPNWLDNNSDGDWVGDAYESTSDGDGDGSPGYLDPDEHPNIADIRRRDTDGDGTPDDVEALGDGDGDGVPAWLDPDETGGDDSDGDGITDSDEATLGTDPSNPDTDGDGLADGLEVEFMTDPLAIDSDGDGIDDFIETDGGVPVDTDGDEDIDALDLDSDDDGRGDTEEYNLGDRDGDGTPNYRDPDDDGDGIATATENQHGNSVRVPGNPWPGWDLDGDGIVTWLDLESDGDGAPDSVEGTGDQDGNGRPDYLDPPDSDGDGIPDLRERLLGSSDINPDPDRDGRPDSLEVSWGDPGDCDGDGIIDAHDIDSDNDGILDRVEWDVSL